MSDFDPYYQWLGIPLQEQPASHYRLLGIPEFDGNVDIIKAAAERQTIYLRTLQAGEHAVLVAELLNEVSQARVTLLNEDQKAAYDEELRKQQTPEPEAEPTPPPIPVVQTPTPAPTPVVVRGTVTQEFPVSVVQTARKPRRRKRKEIWKQPVVIGVSVVAVSCVLVFLISLMFSGDAEPVVNNTPPVVTSPLIPSPQPAPRPTTPPPTASNKALPAKVAAAPPLAVAPFDAAQATAHQQAWSKYVGVPVEYTNSIGMKFMLIPPGKFMMGSNEFEDNEKPVHKVTLASPFQLGAHEVTQEQYAKVVGDNPSKFKGPTNPVEANWPDAVAFCSLLTDRPEEKLAGRRYRLPSEAEWEYSCRAGTTTAFSFGSDASLLAEFGWIARNSGGRTHPVGEKKPNTWGLYDMHGNVWERCMDWKGNYPSKDVVNPQGPSDVTIRMTRGGGFNDGNNRLRSATRGGDSHSSNRSSHNGFRVILEIPVRAQPNTIAADTKSLPASLTKRLVTRPPFRDNIKDVILALSFDGDEVVTQEGNMYLKDSSPVVNIVHTNSAAFVSTPTGEGMVFDGFDDTVLVRNFRSQLTQKKEGLTVACLLKITKPGFVLDIGADGQQLSLVNGAFMFMQSGSYPDTVRNDEMSPKLDQWLMMVGTWDGNKETTYVNGEIYHSRTGRVQGPISDRSFPSAGGYNHLYVGQQNKGFRRTGRGFGGILDELLLFKRALSAAEVKSLYDFEKP